MKWFFRTLTALLLTATTPTQAAMTDWTEVQGGAVRLIASGPLEDGHYLAGLEFLLEPGWHTYWRYAGEAGIPPQITLTDKTNIKSLEILYPVPERYSDGFSESIVYHDGIVLPIRIQPETPDRPVQLTLDLFFGICKDICVPGDAKLALTLSRDGKTDTLANKLIGRDLAAVPGKTSADGLTILSVMPADDTDGVLVIETTVPGPQAPDLFAAGPAGSYVGLPKLVDRVGEKATWHLSTKGLKSSPDDDALRLVLTNGKQAVEHLEPVRPAWVN